MVFRPALRLGFMAAVCTVVVVVGQMWSLETDASLYLSFGEESTATLEYGQERLGDVFVKPNLGHDGRLFYIAAHDPLITDQALYEDLFERPVYRAQRVLFPLLVAPALLAGEWAAVWWMLVLNIGAIGVGTYLTARLAEEIGLSYWFGLAFVLNPGVWAELNAGGSGAIAWALAVGGLLAFQRERHTGAMALFALAALSREAMVLIPLGLAAWLWRRRERVPVWLVAIPIGAVAAWAVYVRLRLGESLLASQSREFDWPFVGLVEAADEWIARSDAVRIAAGAAYAVILIRALAVIRRVPHAVGWAAAGFVVLAPMLSAAVWFDFWDISRAVLPVVTVSPLLAGIEIQRRADRTAPTGT